ncbi:hypothetical protein SAMN05414139_10580 [Burkholderia sp. D7]|nr:hypothetical protein SAMN05414139_10580 [Burkholderia sp. D7]
MTLVDPLQPFGADPTQWQLAGIQLTVLSIYRSNAHCCRLAWCLLCAGGLKLYRLEIAFDDMTTYSKDTTKKREWAQAKVEDTLTDSRGRLAPPAPVWISGPFIERLL